MVGSQGIPQNHTTDLTQVVYWGRHKRVVASAQERNSKELSRRQALYRVSGGGRAQSFPL